MEHPAAGEMRLDGLQTQFRGLPNPNPRRVPRCREANQRGMIPPSSHLGQFLCFISKCGTLTAQPQVSQRILPRVLSEVKEAEGLEDARRAPPRDFAAGGKGRARVSAAWNSHQWLQVAAAGKLCALTSYRGTRGGKETNLPCPRGAPNPPRARVLRALRGVGR